MIYRMIILFLLVACGETHYSPYHAEVARLDHNQTNLSKVLSMPQSQHLTKTTRFSFAVISDTHDYYDGLEKQIRYINKNAKRYDFVIVSGDMTNVGLASEFKATKDRLDKLKIPYLTTSGNHDLLIDGKKIYQRLFGKDTYSFKYLNTKFVLYNNNNWESASHIPDMNWLEHELQNNESENLIVISHVAPNDPDRFSKTEIKQTIELLNRYQVNYYINGHNHNPGEDKLGETTHLTAGASSKDVLLELNIFGRNISHAFINL